MKKISVVILNWNGKELMEKFLPSVIEYSPENIAEIVVADNGSTDGSLDMLRKKFPSVRLIEFDKNYGFAEGYNKAINEIESPYTVLLNSDVEVTERWLQAPLEILETKPEVAAVQPKILAYNNKDTFEYAGAAGGFIDKYGYPFCRGRIFNVVEKDNKQYDKPQSIFWASGACMFIKTEIYKNVGGLDGEFFAHQEEIDLCWRLKSRGYQILCIPESVVYHVGGATLNVESPRKTFLNFRNNLLMLYKNLLAEDMKHVMRVRCFLDYIAALKFLVSGHPANAKAVIDARKEFKKISDNFWEKRKENLSKRTVRRPKELLGSSLLLNFYLKGIKTFDKIEGKF